MGKQDIQAEASARLGKYRSERQRFIELIRRQEELASSNPGVYRRKVITFAMLGYGYIVFVLLILIGLLIGLGFLIAESGRAATVEVKLGLFLVILIVVVIRSLFITIPPPDGKRVSREEAPKLWAEADALAEMFNAPKVDEIVIDMDMNAAAAQRPRFGFFGGNQNYLLLGLPLMYSLPVDEMRSVMAHEFGHFSGKHGKLGGWIYRLNQTFARIQFSLHQNSANLLFRSFYDWFQPRFDAISFAMRRQNEYEADTAAVRVVGSKAASRALMRLSYLPRALDEGVLEPISDLVKTQPVPPTDPFRDVQGDMARMIQSMNVGALLDRDLAERTGYEDSHPSLTDRLRAMNELPGDKRNAIVSEIQAPLTANSADAYLGRVIPLVVDFYNKLYGERVLESWSKQYESYSRSLEDLEVLNARIVNEETLTRAEQIDHAFLTLRIGEPKNSLPMFERLVAENPQDAEARYGLGEAKLALGDSKGEEDLRAASRMNMSLLESATKEIAAFRLKHGVPGDLDELKEEFLERAQVANLVQRERSMLQPKDEFTSTTFDAVQREKLCAQLKNRKDLKRAYLVSKIIRLETPQQFNVLIVEPANAFLATTEKNDKLTDRLIKELELPGSLTIFAPTDLRPWKKKFAMIGDSLLFEN